MSVPQILIISLVIFTLALFILDRIRYDFVALAALITGVIIEVIPAQEAFDGFGHPAVITVASVLILSRALADSGVTDVIEGLLDRVHSNFILFNVCVCFIGMILSSFINNVGALALMMPVAINSAQKMGKSPGLVLMPLSFSSVLGGLITLIGTPPNIVISSFRAKNLGAPFDMFDFTPVGLIVAVLGTLFVSLIGWMLLPKDRTSAKPLYDLLQIGTYVTELQIVEESPLINQKHKSVEKIANQLQIDILGLIRHEHRYLVTPQKQTYQSGDILIVEADAKNIDRFSNKYKLKIKGSDERLLPRDDDQQQSNFEHIEVTVGSNSLLASQIVSDIGFNKRYGINLLAVARQGHPYKGRLKYFKIQVGDVLLLEGEGIQLSSFISSMYLMPLARRNLKIGGYKNFWKCVAVFSTSILLTASGILSAQVSFTLGALTMVLTRVLPAKDFYESIDWPIVVLLGSMIPISNAFESTGAAEYLVNLFLSHQDFTPAFLVGLVLVVTMFLTDVLNNAATSLIMAPIAVSLSQTFQVSPDTFLMAVAIGASCSFLTPIGHQNNALILGPGGYRFGDYWRLGLPLEILIAIIAIPSILMIWPLNP